MAAPTFRDRMLSHRGARALLSPVGLLVGIAVAVVLAVAGLPVWAAVLAGVALWALNVVRLAPRGRRRERIDPFTLQEPWRRFVQDALQARARFAHAVERIPPGPLRDRLGEIEQRVQTGVEECWQVAKRGQVLVRARRGIDVADIERRLAQLERAAAGDGLDEADRAVQRSLASQRASADRLDQVIERAQRELRLLDARLEEAVVRTIEISAQATGGAEATGGLGADIDAVVSEMEALRLALDEAGVTPAGGATAGPRDLPPGGAR